ncbi:hypothetical protein [Nonomuraea jabiensis]|uniref:hypothetical protein n=1 Tax=Nonomuraea jabiensis TaxID=882448 RepID=UPI003D7443FC
MDGEWKIIVKSPMGSLPVTLSLCVDGNTLSGTQSGQGQTAEITEGVIDGDAFSWAQAMTTPAKMTMRFSGTVHGDSLTGTVEAGFMGTFPFSGNRI